MREFKFRAWNKKKKFMYVAMTSLNLNGAVYSCSFIGGCGDEKTECIDNLEIMQYTGVKDKTGREIYEGDILRGKYLDYVVVWICNDYHCGFYKKSGDNYTDLNNHSLSEKMEVIGNIYENHELIGK